MLDGVLFHTRCAYHIFNFYVKEGHKCIDDITSTIRNVILFIETSPIRLQNFEVL
jgi:hypothetical protein